MASESSTMRRWQVPAYGGADKLELVTLPLSALVPAGQVRVRVLATTATYTDLLIIRGNYRPAAKPPVTPGYDCVGVVDAVGEGVAAVKPGDRVALMPQGGCMATHVTLPQRLVVPIRDDVAPLDAVSVVLTGVTAYQMLHRSSGGRLSPQARLLVHGCTGGTGAMIVELAKAAGVPAANIFGTCSARNLATASAMGIVAIDYGAGGWDARVLEATGGEGVDLIYDAVMLGGYLTMDWKCLRRGGKLVCYGLTNAAAPGTAPVPSILLAFTRLAAQQKMWSWFNRQEAEFYNVSRRRDAHPDEFAADLAALLDLVAKGTLRPLVGQVWPFEQAKDALAAIEANSHTGKQLIRVADA
jgi:NADPH:quinone reductase-like Zn-dependent oxidoreductase